MKNHLINVATLTLTTGLLCTSAYADPSGWQCTKAQANAFLKHTFPLSVTNNTINNVTLYAWGHNPINSWPACTPAKITIGSMQQKTFNITCVSQCLQDQSQTSTPSYDYTGLTLSPDPTAPHNEYSRTTSPSLVNGGIYLNIYPNGSLHQWPNLPPEPSAHVR